MTPSEETKRLLNLIADHLENNVSDEAFDLSDWKNECGTVGCVMGHAENIPELKQMGYSCQNTPYYKGEYAWDAIEKLLNIEWKDAENLFTDYAYNYPYSTKADVINRIRSFAK